MAGLRRFRILVAATDICSCISVFLRILKVGQSKAELPRSSKAALLTIPSTSYTRREGAKCSCVLKFFQNILEQQKRQHPKALPESLFIVIFCEFFILLLYCTDTLGHGTALRAVEIKADVILLAKNIDGVYDSDPLINKNAKKFDKITHTEVLERDLKVMDSTAASLCRDNNMKIHLFGLAEKDAILKACRGEKIGTVVY